MRFQVFLLCHHVPHRTRENQIVINQIGKRFRISRDHCKAEPLLAHFNFLNLQHWSCLSIFESPKGLEQDATRNGKM